MAAIVMVVEMLHCQPESPRTAEMFTALRNAAAPQGVIARRTSSYRGDSPWLLLWGVGAPSRAAIMAQHIAAGGHCVVWDLAYWDRHRKMRVSVDAPHPVGWVMRRDLPRQRFVMDRVPIASQWNPRGPVLIAGLGDKARVQYGASVVDQWEADVARECAARWPDRPVLYRQKKAWGPVPSYARQASLQPIDQALNGISLVATWHSNVAVDAIRMGIPVICRDGAAAAVCPAGLGHEDPRPLSEDARDRFLGNLAWFQWAPHEAVACWAFLRDFAPMLEFHLTRPSPPRVVVDRVVPVVPA